MNKLHIILSVLCFVATPLLHSSNLGGKEFDAKLQHLLDLRRSTGAYSKDLHAKLIDKKIREIRHYIWVDASEQDAAAAVARIEQESMQELVALVDVYRQVNNHENELKIPVFASRAALDEYIQTTQGHEEDEIKRLVFVLLRNRAYLLKDYDPLTWKQSAIAEAFRRFGIELGYVQYPISKVY